MRPSAAELDCAACQLEVLPRWRDAYQSFSWLYKNGMGGPEPIFTAAEGYALPQPLMIYHRWMLAEIAQVQEEKRVQEEAKRRAGIK